MALRPEEIEKLKFSTRRRGYDKSEVDSFLAIAAKSTRELEDRLAAATQSGAAPAASAATAAPVQPAPNALSHDVLGTDETADMERAIIDRYGALGDRIAELLRSADDSADQLRHQAEADAAEIRANAEAEASQLLAEAKAMRDEAETYRVEVTAEVEEMRATATAEIEELKNEALSTAELLRAEAREEAQRIEEKAYADGVASLDGRAAEIEALEEQTTRDREQARAELDDVRSQVTVLLEQARSQSEFIKQEAEEIIRTKVRANMENAQSRIDILRNTEVVSRERILLAQKELASALSRLESDDAPQITAPSEDEVLEEATRRGLEMGGADAFGTGHGDVIDAESTVVESTDAGVVEAELVEAEAVEAQAVEAQAVDVESTVVESDPMEVAPGWAADGFDEASSDARAVFGFDERAEAATGVFGVEVPAPVAAVSADEFADDIGGGDAASMDRGDTSPLTSPAHEEEDALARLVREAMQEAVDSARKVD